MSSMQASRLHLNAGMSKEDVMIRVERASLEKHNTLMFIWSLHFYCRDKLAFTQSRAASYFFDGSSYAVVRDITRRGKFGQVTRFDIEVRTPADNGLVLLMINGVSKNKSPPSSPLFPLLSTTHIFRNLSRMCHANKLKF